MMRTTRSSIFARTNPEPEPRCCDAHGCDEHGLYKAPKSPHQLREYYYFCLKHVREYNKAWDYYAGLSEAEIEKMRQRDTIWDRPSWPIGSNAAKMEAHIFEQLDDLLGPRPKSPPPPRQSLSKEAKARRSLGLGNDADFVQIKMRYRHLVKKYHPDRGESGKEHLEKMKEINEAYSILKSQHQLCESM